MKKGFTLVEMLIVVVVIVTLMSMTFRLSSIGDDSNRRNTTLARLNQIENCLSGYYAAFGSYPPVALHGSRNIYAKVSDYGIQSKSEKNKSLWGWTKIGEKKEVEDWEQVKAACKAQPVAASFPFPEHSGYNALVKVISRELQKKAQKAGSSMSEGRKNVLSSPFDNGVTDNIGRHSSTESDWRDVQLFKFGLMSYLLPRYRLMMNSSDTFFRNNGYAQWRNSNSRVPCNPFTGEKQTWTDLHEYNRKPEAKDLARIMNIPSQAVTARWMPNLAGIVCCNHDYEFFGIKIRGDEWASELQPENTDIEVFSPGGYGASGSGNQYVLDKATVLDGWGKEFYYYSPSPHQTYTLWSAGPNDRTFPPWVSRKELGAAANKCVALWTEDDIVRMSN